MNKRKENETDFPEERPDGAVMPEGAAHRSADDKSKDFVVEVCDRITAPSRQVPVEKDAQRTYTPLRCGGLAGFFGDKNIIEQLCARRMKLASRRHEKEFFTSMLEGAVVPTSGTDEAPLLPGRKQWRHYRPYESQRHGRSQPNLQALMDATLRLRKMNPDLVWNKNLKAKIAALTSRVFGPCFAFAPPKILPQPKRCNEYRAIAAFQDDDKLIGSLTAQYFRQQFDPLFLDCSLAFRLRSHEDPRMRAMERIDELRQRHEGAPIYVAEADIMGFFDTVDHGVAWERLEALADAGNIALDPKALAVLRAYLDGYSFPSNVLGTADQLRSKMGADAHFAWPLDQLRALLHKDPLASRVGIPQGGALSHVIANVMLHFADAAVERFRLEGHDLLYFRFCDDVIFLSSSREVTARAFEIYLDQLRLLKLPVYPPVKIARYCGEAKPEYWAAKSKATFAWGTSIEAGEIPWIGFLGYELRRNGLLRIRRSSIDKQKDKITAIVGHAVRHLDHAIEKGSSRFFRVSLRSFVNRVVGKVIATSVGRMTIGTEVAGPCSRTFASGFRFLVGKWFPLKMFRELDRHRERNIRRLKRRAGKVPAPKMKSHGRKVRVPKFFGRPFSYLAQFYSRNKHRRNPSPTTPSE